MHIRQSDSGVQSLVGTIDSTVMLVFQLDNWSNQESWQVLGSRYLKIRSASPLASLPMGDLQLVHALGLEAPSQRLLDRLSDRALDSAAPILVPRWNRPAGPAVDGGNGQGINVGEANDLRDPQSGDLSV